MNSQPKKSNKTLILLFVVFLVPVALAKLVLSMDWYHGGATNKGALLNTELNYSTLEMDNPKPHLWQLVYLLPEKCNEQCVDRLYIINQSHIALGRDRDRIVPMILLQDNSDIDALKQLHIPFDTAAINSKMAELLTSQQMIIVDPLGSLVMQYDAVLGRDANIVQGKAIIADLRKMLKLSRVG
ncbi:hypothetical protein [Shewanella sp. OMA3-2]|uniref:hypothetical protein n=1 Tax=Shewanella sp. OMA3-2 TaxID=2908650 RepID=UPI001F25C311|nr:hypothetical protein [Shewanella sp. OMA3-2]UJF22067.1 hypothetical protein L0B17_00950 [Shewanella sp. OMA3-2]